MIEKKQKLEENSTGEHGVAIVLALGITALLMGLLITFIITTQTEKKASVNFNNINAAKMFAESALRRAVIAMTAYSPDPSVDISSLSSHKIISESDPDSEAYFDELEENLTTVVNGISYYEWPSDYNAAGSDAVTWVYIEEGDGIDSTIIGRMAYVIVSDKGKIDPSSAVDSGENGTPYTEGNAITMINTQGSEIEGRPGRSITELYLNSLSSWFESDTAVEMSADNAIPTSGDLHAGTRWVDFATLFTELGISDSLIEDSFRAVFNLNTPKDAEAFWVDISNNAYKEPLEMYHRFDLARSNWNDLDVDSIVTDSAIPFTTAYSEDAVTAIPWIKNWKFPGTDTLSDTMSKQIAANLIDYNDSNSVATTDYPTNNPPTYVGLDDSPYINEIEIDFSGTLDGNGNATISAETDLELLYMYNTDLITNPISVNPVITISGSYSVSYTNISSSFPYPTVSDTTSHTFTNVQLTKTENVNSQYKTINILLTAIFTSIGNEPGTIVYRSIDDFKITDMKVNLNDGTGTLLDFSYLVDSTSEDDPSNSVMLYYWRINDNFIDARNLVILLYNIFFNPDVPYITLTPGSSEGEYTYQNYYHGEINDPRQNLYISDWGDTEFSQTDPGDTLGGKNSNCDPNPGGNSDEENGAVDPWDISTAYIRNEPMKSPWELGFIHRAAAWQTINLKKYNDVDDAGMLSASGGNSYINGDANILDQVKMGAERENYGKINLNTDVSDVFKVLFQEIYVGSDVGSADGPGDTSGAVEVDETDANTLKTSVLSVNSTNGGSVFYTRSQIVRGIDGVSQLYDNTLDAVNLAQTTDAKQEEIIGKFINLTKASQPNLYTIITVGEFIKDIGEITVNKKGTSVTTTLGVFDIGGDEILGTCKIMATVQYDPVTGKMTVLRFQFLSE